ncbi:hypothetical protein CERSUDRAFT_148142 [Gelatoporia subvermispora B]|uniref:Uncharacterized protein n=1 Tax=Ceriporiopsis subvermispora (strain B) TaxID=914234 RepID=M2RN21_CERS8|nr:hypothetical protein CERSUDRAFT_148142 [Gelatoporia subvermispora B]
MSKPAAIHERFDEIATMLLQNFRLVINNSNIRSQYDILELEFYLRKPDCHEDPFTHCSEEQRCCGQWYFHRAPRKTGDASNATAAGGYRGGSRKGLDLTLGYTPAVTSRHFASSSTDFSPEKTHSGLRGGILVRTVRRISDGKVISGPSLLVDEILSMNGASSVSELVQTMWRGDISAFAPPQDHIPQKKARMFLEYAPRGQASTNPRIFRSPRIGLDLSHSEIPTTSHDHPRILYVDKLYRYFTHPHLLNANGRGHTFLGVYKTLKDSTKSSVEVGEEVARLTGLQASTIAKYLHDYNAGVDNGRLVSFIGKSGKGASASPPTFLRMMGTLERFGAALRDPKA